MGLPGQWIDEGLGIQLAAEAAVVTELQHKLDLKPNEGPHGVPLRISSTSVDRSWDGHIVLLLSCYHAAFWSLSEDFSLTDRSKSVCMCLKPNAHMVRILRKFAVNDVPVKDYFISSYVLPILLLPAQC